MPSKSLPLPLDDRPLQDATPQPHITPASQSHACPDAAFLDKVLGMIEGRIAPKGGRFRHARPPKGRGRK